MSTQPPITISTRDFERLNALLERDHAEAEVADDLLDELARATLLEPAQMPGNVVAMNSRARFRNEDSGQEFEVELVFPHEANGPAGRLSVLTPAGAALLGLAVGDVIAWPVNGGKPLRLRLLAVQAPAARH